MPPFLIGGSGKRTRLAFMAADLERGGFKVAGIELLGGAPDFHSWLQIRERGGFAVVPDNAGGGDNMDELYYFLPHPKASTRQGKKTLVTLKANELNGEYFRFFL